MKKCFKCKKKKEIENFYVHNGMTDGHLGKCKTCTKKDVAHRYDSPEGRLKVRLYEKKRFQDPKRKKKVYEYQLKRRSEHKKKYKAGYQVVNAIRDGILKRMPCEVCGKIKSQAHHEDYRKPLNVKWLCFKHHREKHGQIVG